jgi:hypothetical protein
MKRRKKNLASRNSLEKDWSLGSILKISFSGKSQTQFLSEN